MTEPDKFKNMDDEIGLYDCPMPDTFKEKFGLTLSLAWMFYLGFVSRVIFGPLMPEIQKELGFTHLQSGYLFMMIGIGFLMAPFFSGFISSRINHLGNLKLSAWLLGVTLLPLIFVKTFWGMSIVLITLGFAGSLHLPSAVATITAEMQKSDWGKGMGVHQCGPPLAFISAPLLAALLLDSWSWRAILFGWALLSLLSALLFTIFCKGGSFPGRPINLANVKRVAAIPSSWIITILLSMGVASSAGIGAMLPSFFVNERGVDLGSANTMIGCSQISGLLLVFFAGMAADKFGVKRCMLVTLIGTALLTIALGFATGWLLIVVLFLQPAFLTAFFPVAYGALARVVHPSSRSVISAMVPPMAFAVGAGVIPVVIGYLAESSSFSTGIIVAGTYILLGTPLVFFLRLGDFEGAPGC